MKGFRGFVIMSMALTMFFCQTNAQSGGCDKPVEAGLYDMGKMWTFDYPPADYFQDTYGFKADKKWFGEARLSSLRFADYCSASFVSANGLVMTNHHCARESGMAIERKGENVLENGFYASRPGDERKVPGLFVDQLVMTEDITQKVQTAISGVGDDMARIAGIEMALDAVKKEYSAKDDWKDLELETVSFYSGGKYSLYGFKRYKDVRLVFMPEEQMAYFGGDYDNFTYPRYDLDCSFFRVYEDDKPLKTEHFFKYNVNGASEGEAVFVIGNPGRTSRMSTVSDLEFYRDKQLPFTSEILGKLSEMYKTYNTDAKSDSIENLIFMIDNSLKVYKGELEGLRDPCTIARKAAFHEKFRAEVMKRPSLVQDTIVWNEIAGANAVRRDLFDELSILNAGSSMLTGRLLQYAKDAVSLAAQYPDTAGKGEAEAIFAAPYRDEAGIEKKVFGIYLREAYNRLGPDNQFVKVALNGRSPEDAAAEIISETKMTDQMFRNSLLSMDSATLWKVNDQLINLARIAYAEGRQLAGTYQYTEAILNRSKSRLGEMLFEIYGTSIPPDATFSLRINDGVVKKYEYNGTIAPVNTTFFGLYDRYQSFGKEAPYDLPARWKKPIDKMLNTPLDFISTNDIIGGNSGSPMINKDLEIVGLAFDGNIESLLGSYIFLPDQNRAIGVHSAGIIAALRYVYKAKRLVSELEGRK